MDMDPFAHLEPAKTPFSMSNVSINLGAATNDTNQQRVLQTTGLDTLPASQDAFHVVSRDNYTSVPGSAMQPVTLGYEPKPEPSPAIPEIAPGLVRLGIEQIRNLVILVRRSNSSPGTP
eukprot:3475018-Amphidinium_carterae.1